MDDLFKGTINGSENAASLPITRGGVILKQEAFHQANIPCKRDSAKYDIEKGS